MGNLIATMLVWASYLSGYPMTNDNPLVVLVPHSYFVENACHGIDTKDDPCTYVGLYTYDDKMIHIDNNIDKQLFDAILVHELVHYLQDINNRWTDSICPNKISREHEAYAVEQRYIYEAQHRDNKLFPPSNKEICKL